MPLAEKQKSFLITEKVDGDECQVYSVSDLLLGINIRGVDD